MSSDNIKVAIKVRPLLKKEKDLNLRSFWKIIDNSIQHIDSQNEPYYFDHIFDQDTSNQDIFDTIAKPIIDAALRGIHGTIFAYGQTSSGKTYTMLGNEENPGVMALAVKEIIRKINNMKEREFLVRVGYIEIYNEKIYDLLNKKNQDLKIHETANGDITVNCSEYVITCEEEMMEYLYEGSKQRKIGETNMNERSSRSHTIFRIIIESREIGKSADDDCIQISNLNLVDLAGSERADQTGATGNRLKEGGHINRSLLTLSRVINKLSENESDKHINYRDSKLTRILQASLGGNALTAIICNIKSTVAEETMSTLNFASRAKSIKNKPIVNAVLSDAAMMKKLQKEITKLQAELEIEKSKNSKIKILQLQKQIKEEELKIISSCTSANRSKKSSIRRRTWCTTLSVDQTEDEGDTLKKIDTPNEIKTGNKFMNVFLTPLITIRDNTYEEKTAADCFPSNKDETNLWPMDKEIPTNIDEFKGSLVTNMRGSSEEENLQNSSPNIIYSKYKQLKKEYEQLKSFSEKEKISNDELYRKEKQLEYLQEKCNNLEQYVNELNENLNKSKEKEKNYEDQLNDALKRIQKLDIAVKDADSYQFQYEQDKQRLKKREEELLEALIQRQQTIDSLKKMHSSSSSSSSSSSYIEKLDKEIMVCLVEEDNQNQTQGKMSLNENMNEILKEKSDKIKELRKENKKLLNEYNELSNQMVESIQENDDLKDDNTKLLKEINIYKNELIKLNNSIIKKYNSVACDDNIDERKNDLDRSISKAIEIIEKILFEKDQTIEILQEKIEYLETSNKDNLHNLKVLNSRLENKNDNKNDDKKSCPEERIHNKENYQIMNEMIDEKSFTEYSQIKSFVTFDSSSFSSSFSSVDIKRFEKLKTDFESMKIENEKIEKYNKQLQNDLVTLEMKFIDDEKNLQNEIELIKNEKNSIEVKMLEMIKSNEDLNKLINELKLEKSNDENKFSCKIEELNSENYLQKQEIDNLKMMNTELEKKNSVLKINKINETNEENERIIYELRNCIDELQREIDNLKEENLNIKKRKDQIENMNHKLQEHLNNFDETDQQNEKINNELQECIKKLREEIDNLKKENSYIQDRKDQIENMNLKLQEHLKEYERNDEDNEKINNELQKCVMELRQEIDSLQRENISIKNKKDQIESMAKRLEEQLKEYETEKVDKTTTEYLVQHQNDNDNDKKKDTLIMKKDQTEKINNVLKKNSEKYDDAKNEETEKYSLEVVTENSKITNLDSINDNLIVATDLQNKCNQCETKCNDLLVKIEELSIRNKSLEENNLQLKQDVDEISKRLELLNTEKKVLENLTNLIKDNRQNEIEKVKLLENDKNYYQEKLELNRKENNELQERLRKDSILLKQVQDECNILKTSTQELMGNIIIIEKEKNSLETENTKLKIQIENYLKQNENDLENLKLTFEEKLLKHENQTKYLNENILYLKNEVEKYKEEADEYRNRTTGLENKLKIQIEENEVIFKNMKNYETEISELNSQLELLKASNDELLDENKKIKNLQTNDEVKSLQWQLEQLNNLKDSYKDQVYASIAKLKKLDEDKTNAQSKLICSQSDNKILEIKMRELNEKIEILQKDFNIEKNLKLKWENNYDKLVEKMKELKNKYMLAIEENTKLIEKHKDKIPASMSNKDVTTHSKVCMKLGNNMISRVYECTNNSESTGRNKIHSEKNSLKLKDNDRKLKRYSSHDEQRFIDVWEDHVKDVETMTDPTDKLCNCEVLDKKIKDFQRQILIQECHISTLQMQIDCNSLLNDNKKLKKYLEDANNQNNEYKIEIELLNKKIMDIQKSKKNFIDKFCQTENDELPPSNRENELKIQIENYIKENNKLQMKYEYMMKSCRKHKEQAQEEFEKLQSENELLKKKYSEVKFLLGEYRKDAQMSKSSK